MSPRDTLDRRSFVRRTGAVTGLLALAGCLGSDDGEETVEAPEFIEIEDPPDAVYVPTHREAMRVLEPIEAGDVAIAPMLSYPHSFWIVAGGSAEDALERVDPADGRGVHMMITVWDRETGIVLPVDEGAQLSVERDGEQVGSPRSPWAMLSQEMGFHFGDNVPLPEDGAYTVTVDLPSISTPTTGALEDRLTEPETATFEFTYDDAFREAVVGGIEYFDEEFWGTPGALEPMDHGDQGDGHDDGPPDEDQEERGDDHDHRVPYSALPPVEAYPGTVLREPDAEADAVPAETTDLPRSGDAAFLATVLESGSRLAADGEQYLLVSPRTPYNRVPLADMSVTATIERDGETVAEPSLTQTIDGEYDLHYGASLELLEAGDSVTITIESPPQVARHQGYETAFLEMPPVELVVPEGSDR